MSKLTAEQARRKFKRERWIGRTFLNPAVTALNRLGIRSSLMVELETTGRRTGQPRRVPLTGRVDDTGLWVICQHGRRAGWAINIDADPRVRVRIGDEWRTGTATFEPDDDVVARARSFGGTAVQLVIKALESDPISVRVTFD